MNPLTPHSLTRIPSRRKRRRVGRGNASRGTYSGRGMKGQRSRAGGRRGIIRRSIRSLLERVPKQRGFRSMHAKFTIVNVDDLDRVFDDGDIVSPDELVRRGMIDAGYQGIKVLGNGTIRKSLTVKAHAFSSAAKRALEAVGGKTIVLSRSFRSQEKADSHTTS